jgi:DNA repair exonuclease SbcCD ATPase subunit
MDSLLPKSRVCTKCGEEKLLEEFYKNKSGTYGRQSYCKLCNKQYRQENKEKKAEYHKQYRQNNRERLLEQKKQDYQENRESILESQKQYRQNNKERIAEYGKKYRKENKERIAEYLKQYRKENKERYKQYCKANKEKLSECRRQYRQNNKERFNEWRRNHRKNDEQFRIRENLSISLYHTLNKIGKTKNASILTYIGCSVESLQEHLNSTKKPDWGDDLHIDHIIPKMLFDHINEEEIKKCWNWRNLRYLPAEENKSKGNTLDMDLVKSYGIEDLLPVGVDK